MNSICTIVMLQLLATHEGDDTLRRHRTSLAPRAVGPWSGKWVGEGQTEEALPATIQVNAIENRDGKLFAVGEVWWEDYAP